MESSLTSLIAVLGVVALGIVILVKTAVVVPQQSAFVVERLGKFNFTFSFRSSNVSLTDTR